MVWAVYAPTTRAAGFLAGTYAGVSAEVTVAGGIGANILVGGSFRTVELQPLSVQEQTGINVAEVHLWGPVGSPAERTALIALAEDVPGVTEVVDEMIPAY